MKDLLFGWKTPYTPEPPPYLDEEAKKTHPIDPPNRERSYWGRQAIEYLDVVYKYDSLFAADSIIYCESETPWVNSVGEWEEGQIKKRLAHQKELRAEYRKEAEKAKKEAEAQQVIFRESQRIRTTTSPADYILALRQRPGLLYVDLKLCSRILCPLWDICARGVKHPDQAIGRKITKAEFLKWQEGPDN